MTERSRQIDGSSILTIGQEILLKRIHPVPTIINHLYQLWTYDLPF
jgi:hypothetical protein